MDKPVVGLTGGIGAGKTTVATLFAGWGIPCVDTDEIARALTLAGGAAIPAIRQQFGAEVLTADGALDRAAMRALVFEKVAARQQLEAILHPLIREQSLQALSACDGPYALLAVPLLFETAAYSEVVRRSLVIDCPTEMQIARVMQRSQLPREQVEAIIAAQMPRDERVARADDVIVNHGDLPDLALQVADKHRYYLACFGLPAPA